MRSIPLALAWDYHLRSRRHFALSLAAFAGLVSIVCAVVAATGAVRVEPLSHVRLHFAMMWVGLSLVAAAVMASRSPTRRLHALPVATWKLVAVEASLNMAGAVAIYLAAAAVANLGFGAGWPLVGPALFLAAGAAAVQAVMTLGATSLTAQLLAATGLAAIAFLWLGPRYGGASLGGWQRMWTTVTPGEWALLLGVIAASFGLAVLGTARDRRGEAWRFDFPGGVTRRGPGRAVAPRRPFRSATTALFWHEWRSKGWAMLAVHVAAAAVLLVGTAAYHGWIKRLDTHDLVLGVPLLLLTLQVAGAPALGLILGRRGAHVSWRSQVPTFQAAQPVTVGQQAAAVLKTAGLATLASWAMWAASLGICICWCLARGDQMAQVARIVAMLNPGMIVSCLVIEWVALSLTAALVMTGRPCVLIVSGLAFAVGLPLTFWLTFWAVNHWLPEAWQDDAVSAVALILASVLLLGTAGAFGIAFTRQHIGHRGIALAAVVWLSAAMAVLLPPDDAQPAEVTLLRIGLNALLVLPLVATPLAIAWNRHR